MSNEIKVSKMSGKLQGILAINTNPLTNAFCTSMRNTTGSICQSCYSCKMLSGYRKNCVPAFEHNSNILSSRILDDVELPKFKDTDVVRIHAHGELINSIHMTNIVNMANKNYNTVIALYTKRTGIVWNVLDKINVPSNLILVYSNPAVDKIMVNPPDGFDKVFNVVTEDRFEQSVNCGGQRCIDCKLCYHLNGQDCIVELLK